VKLTTYLSGTEVRNEWFHTSATPVPLHGVDRDGFTFLPTPCSRAPLDNIPVPKLFQKFFILYGTLRFIAVFTTAVKIFSPPKSPTRLWVPPTLLFKGY